MKRAENTYRAYRRNQMLHPPRDEDGNLMRPKLVWPRTKIARYVPYQNNGKVYPYCARALKNNS
jgi:hypothetical protein